ncbi:MAG TPA: carbohydrate kinase family protein, partial [Ardenticatenaceae bacterium]|nr:carbohydrate kinase family protein [Ardenticatenaceae bacterium]
LGPLSQRDLAVAFKGLGVPQLSLDPGEVATTPDTAALVRESCAVTDAFLPSELEVRLLCGDVDVRAAAEELASWGPPVVAIKGGAAGCLLYERDANRFTTIPAYPARVVDVTGAGDSFCGGFSAGLRRTGDPLRAALMGTVSASFTVEGYGALYTLGASRHEAERRLEALAGATTRI